MFFARWAAELRASGRLADWLASNPAPDGWETFAEALAGRASSDEVANTSGFLRVALELAARGMASPPWALDIAPPTQERPSYDLDAPYPDAWACVLNAAIDDEPTFARLLRPYSAPPPEWRTRVAAWLVRLPTS